MFRQSSPAARRQSIIDVFLLRAPAPQRFALRQQLESMSNEELVTAFDALQVQDELRTQEEKLLDVQAEADVKRVLYQLHVQQTREPQDRKIFADAARTFQFGETEANFLLIRSVIGPNFTDDRIQQALDSNSISLSAPTQEELSKWENERAAANLELDQKGREPLLKSIESRIAESEHRFIIRNFIRTSSTYAQLQERVRLCEEIADNYGPDPGSNNREFCSLLLGKSDNDVYRQRVATLRENKQFAKMSPLEIKTYLANKRTEHQPSHEEKVAAEIISPEEQTLLKAAENDPRPALRERTANGEEIDATYLNQLQKNDFSAYRELLQRHGRVRLEARIRGIK